MKRIKKGIYYVVIGLVILSLTGIGTTYLFRDQIINQFIIEANKYLKTPVHTARPVISFAEFPRVGIMFTDVYIEESYPDSKAPLAKLDKVLVAFNPFDLVMGEYVIDDLTLIKGKVDLKINRDGLENYLVFEKTGEGKEPVDLTLNKVRLIDVKVDYENLRAEQKYSFDAASLKSDLSISNDQYRFSLLGDFNVNRISIGKDSFLQNRKFDIDGKLVYDDFNKKLSFDETLVRTGTAGFDVSGEYLISDSMIDIVISADNANVQTIFSLFPERLVANFRKYQSKGQIYFDGTISGKVGTNESPEFRFKIGSENASVYHPDYRAQVTNLNFNADFSLPSFKDLKSARLDMKGFKAELNGKQVSGNLEIDGFRDSMINADLLGQIDLYDLLGFYPIEQINQGSGIIDFDLQFKGNLKDLKDKNTAQKVSTTGRLSLENLAIELTTYAIPITDLQGTLAFNNNDLSINEMTGSLGESDFKLNGVFRNIIAFVLFPDQPIGVEAKLNSKFINLDQILEATTSTSQQGEYSFSINPKLFLAFDCTIDHLKFRRFEPQNIRGTLKVKDKLALGKDLYADVFGGNALLTGLVDARIGDDILVEVQSSMKDINADQVFYVFENFGQRWIRDEHLKGEVDADVTAEMAFDENLNFKSDRLVSDIEFLIRNGQLNDFEPLEQLSKYVEDKNLSRLRVAEISNSIHIENKTVYLPQMEVRTNVSNIMISGTHSFDQKIDYRVIIPLKTWLGDKNDPAFGAVEEDEFGKSKLFLKIIGTTSDYKIVYDKESVKHKIVADLKKEVQELKDAIKNKGEGPKETVGLNEDEYFDWDDDGDS